MGIIDAVVPIPSQDQPTEIEKLIDSNEPQQRIITAEDTTNQLEEQKLALEKAIQDAKDEEERKKLEAEKKILEEKLAKEKEKAEQAAKAQAEIQQQVITAEETTEQLETPPEPEPTPEPVEVEQVVIEAEETTQQIKQIVECGSNKCLHNDKCRSLPSNASCAPNDTENAWTCNE